MVGLLFSCPFNSSLDWAKSLRIPSSIDEEKNSLCLSPHLLHHNNSLPAGKFPPSPMQHKTSSSLLLFVVVMWGFVFLLLLLDLVGELFLLFVVVVGCEFIYLLLLVLSLWIACGLWTGASPECSAAEFFWRLTKPSSCFSRERIFYYSQGFFSCRIEEPMQKEG